MIPAPAPALVTFSEGSPVDVSVGDRDVADLLSPTSLAFEPFRILRAKVRAFPRANRTGSLGLVGATVGEGVTTTALGLALAIAQEPGQRVLIVEANLLQPSIAELLGVPVEPGLGEWLAVGGADPVPIRRLTPWNISLLEAGGSTERSSELLGSERMSRLLTAAGQAFDSVLVDCPPLTPWADSVALQEHLDGALLVLRARHAKKETIKGALTHIRPGLLQGVVFNDRTEVLPWLRRTRRSRRR